MILVIHVCFCCVLKGEVAQKYENYKKIVTARLRCAFGYVLFIFYVFMYISVKQHCPSPLSVCTVCVCACMCVCVCVFVCIFCTVLLEPLSTFLKIFIAHNIFDLDVHYVSYITLVQHFELQGMRFTNFHYYHYHFCCILVLVIYFLCASLCVWVFVCAWMRSCICVWSFIGHTNRKADILSLVFRV